MIGHLGLYFETSFAVEPELVAATIALAFDSNEVVNDYQINIGQLSITDGSAAKPEAPTGFKVTGAIANTQELFVEWDLEDYGTVKQYNLYAVDKNGNDMYLGGSYDSAYYIKVNSCRCRWNRK